MYMKIEGPVEEMCKANNGIYEADSSELMSVMQRRQD